jgi:hypothetical protein
MIYTCGQKQKSFRSLCNNSEGGLRDAYKNDFVHKKVGFILIPCSIVLARPRSSLMRQRRSVHMASLRHLSDVAMSVPQTVPP